MGVLYCEKTKEKRDMELEERIKEYLEYCKYRKELDEKTLKAYRIDLRQFAMFVGDEYLKKERIDKYITELHKKFKQKTIKRKIASIRAFYACLEERELLLIENPFRKIKVKFREEKTLPRIISRSDIETLLNYMYSIKKNCNKKKQIIVKHIAVVEFLFATGVRVCEVSRLKIEGIDLKSGTVRIEGKGKKERYIQIGNSETLKILNEYYKLYSKEIEKSGYFFVNNRGRRLSEQSIRILINKYAKNAGIGLHITPHMFRHSLATYLIEAGADISYVQRILGHSSIKTTQIYIYVAAEAQAEILKLLHPRNKMKITHAA